MDRTLRIAAVVVALVAATLVDAAAAAAAPSLTCTITWAGADRGVWGRAESWTPARVPDADDTVCLPGTPSVTVSTPPGGVTDVEVGAARLTVVAGVTLVVHRQLLVADGALNGPGTVRFGQPGIGGHESGGFSGAVHLTRGVHVLGDSDSTFHLSGHTTFSGGAVLDSAAYVEAQDATVVDGDGNPANAFTVRRLLLVSGPTVIGVVATVANVRSTAPLQLPRLATETATGALRDFACTCTTPTSIPYPVTTIQDVDLFSGAGNLVVGATGRPALETMTSLTDSSLSTSDAPFTSAGTLAFRRSALFATHDVSARSFQFRDGSTVAVQEGATIRARQGAGTISVRPDTAGRPVRVNLHRGSGLDATVVQDGGVLIAASDRVAPRITHDWRLGPGAAVEIGVGRVLADVPMVAVAVGGAVQLAGALTVTSTGPTRPVGIVLPLITAAGGITGTFDAVTLPAGYALSYSPTSVSVTRVS